MNVQPQPQKYMMYQMYDVSDVHVYNVAMVNLARLLYFTSMLGQCVDKLQPNHDSFQEKAEEEDKIMKERVKISSRNSYGDCGNSIRDLPAYVTLCIPMLLHNTL